MNHRLSIFRSLCTRAPGWTISGLILVAGSACFLAWWVSFKFRNAAGSPPVAASASINVEEIKSGEMILCGNALLNYRTGQLLTKTWLSDFGDAAPPIIKVLPAEKLVICASCGLAQAFGFDGKAKPPIMLDGKPIGPAAYRFRDSGVVFVREGNLWVGHVDWMRSTVNEPKRVTDAGFFRETFRGDWVWHDDILFVPVLGKPHRVDLVSGSVSRDAPNAGQLRRGVSPDGRMSAVAHGRGNFVVIDFAVDKATQFSIRGNFREFLWLDEKRLAVVTTQNEISILDTATGKVTAFATPAAVVKLAAASPKGESVMVGSAKGPMIFSTATGKFQPVGLPMNDGLWISENELLCNNSSTDTTLRGIWRVDANGSKERVANQPIDSTRAASGAQSMIAVARQALWISDGNLWRYDLQSGMVSQLTQNQHLSPNLQILP